MPQGFTPVVAFDACFDAVYGLELVSEDVEGEGLLRGRVPVRDEVLTGHGLLHGGVFASVAEALASRGTALAVMPNGFAAMGLSERHDDPGAGRRRHRRRRGAGAEPRRGRLVLGGRGARRRGSPVRLLADHRRGASDAP